VHRDVTPPRNAASSGIAALVAPPLAVVAVCAAAVAAAVGLASRPLLAVVAVRAEVVATFYTILETGEAARREPRRGPRRRDPAVDHGQAREPRRGPRRRDPAVDRGIAVMP
jgi:hypothetical protein